MTDDAAAVPNQSMQTTLRVRPVLFRKIPVIGNFEPFTKFPPADHAKIFRRQHLNAVP